MRRLSGWLVVVTGVLAAGCGDTGSANTSTAGDDGPEGTITVSAATSLTKAFSDIGEDFSAANPGAEVTFSFDASSALATQIIEGAPADAFASADESNMTTLVDAGLVAGEPAVFARNELVIVTKPGNPEGIESLADLADAGVISLCGAEVPCGRYAAEALTKAGVSIDEADVTRGQNAGATLTAVSEGDAVAGIVYVTDAEGAGEAVEAVAIPEAENVVATYPIGVLGSSEAPEVATAFMDYVLGDEGQAALLEYGFLPPS